MKYQVTLNLTFEMSDLAFQYQEELDDDESRVDPSARFKAFEETELFFQAHSVEDFVKENDAFDFVATLGCHFDVKSAAWDAKEFKVVMIVESDLSAEEIAQELRENSLEDGEYEATYDNGWVVFTIAHSENDERWEFGLTDYRQNEIKVIKL